ncbi:hypothetical protein DID88_000984 [Monilinia fructigena]|uniref:Aldehyde dehydrogenase domain-containing protein n=1 Tax=Monilinia fructigena TaxID=38457 RepID=A0A395IZI9_9HELO|nr:hypothetical protein DID88_000984 [Monilinia fructigena]
MNFWSFDSYPLPVNSLDEAINIVHSIHATPLAFYPFGTKEETDNLLKNVTSGGATVNDSFFHEANIHSTPSAIVDP